MTNNKDVDLPDQIPEPDLENVRYFARGLLRHLVTCDQDDLDVEAEKERVYSVAEATLESLYGRSINEIIEELRKKYNGEN